MSPGTTPEYVYSLNNLKDIRPLNWNYAWVSKWLEYKFGNPFRRCAYLDDNRSHIIFSNKKYLLNNSQFGECLLRLPVRCWVHILFKLEENRFESQVERGIGKIGGLLPAGQKDCCNPRTRVFL